ncbi:uncharacterized protein LOC123626883 isoform X5 [Lemur catta]|uniref:uncharacterized protein LOC123626883 isoform X5 n=1 Tax=Lemur catta TaxID=9447 RepID=UPI001E26854D|nr:uncharacterized protein LOC123626883 isoform X5 [Lemur catta]
MGHGNGTSQNGSQLMISSAFCFKAPADDGVERRCRGCCGAGSGHGEAACGKALSGHSPGDKTQRERYHGKLGDKDCRFPIAPSLERFMAEVYQAPSLCELVFERGVYGGLVLAVSVLQEVHSEMGQLGCISTDNEDENNESSYVSQDLPHRTRGTRCSLCLHSRSRWTGPILPPGASDF